MKDRFQRFNSGRVNFFFLAIITTILFAAVLKITSSVVLPFTVSVLLALVTNSLVKILVKFHIPRAISIFLILFSLLGVLFFVGVVIYSSGRAILTVYPKYEARLTEIYIWVARIFELTYDEHLSFVDNIWGQVGVRSRVRVMTLSFTNTFLTFLKDAVLVAIFMVFFLFEAAFFKDKLDRAFEGSRVVQIKKIGSDIMNKVSRYLSIKFFISVANGVIMGAGLMIIGVEFAVVWGIIQFVGNFIPNFGSITVGLAATAFSLVQFWPNPMPALATAIVILGMNIIISYFIEPKVTGDNLGLSPLVILLSLLIWGWIWGFVGLIIAVPMMVIIKIVCENIPVLEPISILLGSRKATMAIVSKDEDENAGPAAGNSTAKTPLSKTQGQAEDTPGNDP